LRIEVSIILHPRQELPMTTEAITPLRQRMIEDMNSRKLCALAQPRKKLRKAPEKGKETSSTEQPQA
jgi:hypothetical protein